MVGELLVNRLQPMLSAECFNNCLEEIKTITSRPEISRKASAHREVESAIMLTLYPISRKYSAIVMPEEFNVTEHEQLCFYRIRQKYL